MRCFYHYTSYEAFLSIIEKKEIWLTNILKTNDIDEVTYAHSLKPNFDHDSEVDFLSYELKIKQSETIL